MPSFRNVVLYRIQIGIMGVGREVTMTSEPFYSPEDAVTAAWSLSQVACDHEATILNEQGNLVALFGWTGSEDDATPRVVPMPAAQRDAQLAAALAAQDPTFFTDRGDAHVAN